MELSLRLASCEMKSMPSLLMAPHVLIAMMTRLLFTPSERPGRRESRGNQVQGGEEGSTAGLVSPPACERFARDREAGFRRARRTPTRFRRGKARQIDRVR